MVDATSKLLDIAKQAKIRRRTRIGFSPALLRLAVAYVKSEITIGQVCVALEIRNTGSSSIAKMMTVLREGCRLGLATITEKSVQPRKRA